MATRVAARPLGDASPTENILDRPLQDRLVQVVLAPLAGDAIDVGPRSGEHPLPPPLPARVGILPRAGVRQFDQVRPALDLQPVLSPHGREVSFEVGLDRGRQHRDAVLLAFGAAHDKLVRHEVHILDPQPGTLEEAQPGPVHQERHPARHPVETLQNGADLVAAQDDAEPLWALRAYDVVQPTAVPLQAPRGSGTAVRSGPWFWVDAATQPSTASEIRNV